MIKRITALGSVLLLSALPVWVGALGLGNIDLKSGLNQPLEARIPLSSLQVGDLENLHVGLAAPEHFQRAGIDRPFFLAKLKFRPQTGADGSSYVRVFSQQRVGEPFLNFLVEVSWPRGRVIREYTLLLDPPVYGAAISRAVKTTVAVVSKMPVAKRIPAKASQSASPAAAPVVATPATSTTSVPVATGGSYGPTARTDTLWSLARRFRGDPTVSIQQMMLAILRANPKAFSNNNINTLRAGVVLQIPGNQDIEALSKREALAEVRRQQTEWQEMRQGQAARVAKAPVGKPVSDGSAGEKSVESKGDEARLKLVSAGQGVGAGTTADKPEVDVVALRDELNVALEDADTKRVENDNLQTRLAEADALIADLKRLVELKDDNISALQGKISESSATPAVAEVVPPPKALAKPETTVSEPATLLETLQDALPVDPALLGGGIGLLLLLFGISSWLRRRRASAADAETAPAPAVATTDDVSELAASEEEEVAAVEAIEEVVSEVSSIADEPEVPAEVDTEESTPEAEAVAEEDPLAEVNVYLAYERFDQAEELVRGAVEKYPDRHEYKLKLLEIFCAARSVEAFENAAMTLQESVGADHALMEKAHAWWADLSPERALFAPLSEEAPAAFSETHVGAADSDDAVFDVTEAEGSPVVEAEEGMNDTVKMDGMDFDLGFGEDSETDEVVEETPLSATNSDLDFDLGFGEETEEAAEDAVEQEPVGSDSVVDFDLGFGMDADEDEESSAEAETPHSDTNVDFDLGFGEAVDEAEATTTEELAEVSETPEDEGLDIVLGEDEGDVGLSLGDEAIVELPDADVTETVEEADDGLDLVLGDEESVDESVSDETSAESAVPEPDSDFAALFEEETPAADTALDFDLGESAEEFGQLDTVVEPAAVALGEPEIAADDGAITGEVPEVDDDLAALFESDEESAPSSDDEAVADSEGEEESVDGLAALFDEESSDDSDSSLDLTLDGDDSAGEVDADFSTLFEEDSSAEDEDSALDLDLSAADDDSEDASVDFESTQYALQDSPEENDSSASADTSADEDLSVPMDETQAKLDLAQAYVDSGDKDGGRGILEEILAEGNDAQKQEAQALLDQMAGG